MRHFVKFFHLVAAERWHTARFDLTPGEPDFMAWYTKCREMQAAHERAYEARR